MKGFNNLGQSFLCKIPYRFDSHVVNSEVIRFNNLPHERFSDTEEFLTVVDTIPPEFKFYYEDGLHFSNVGLCSIPGYAAYRCLVCIEFLLILSLPDVNAPELVMDACNVKLALVH